MNGANNYIEFDYAGNTDIDNQQITLRVYLTTFVQFATFLHIPVDADNDLLIYMDGASGAVDVKVIRENQTVQEFLAVNFNYNEGAPKWLKIIYRAKAAVAGNDHLLSVCEEDNCGGTTVTDEDDDDLLAFGVSPTVHRFGQDDAGEAPVYFADYPEFDISGY